MVVRAPATQAEPVRAALVDLAARTAGGPLFAPETRPDLRVSADRTVSTLELPVPYEVDALAIEQSLAKLRTGLVPEAVGEVPGVEYAVGGFAAADIDYTAHQSQRLPWVIGFVVGLTVLMMAVAFRSVVALVSGLLNAVGRWRCSPSSPRSA